MKAVALATFMMKKTLVRRGNIFEADESYIKELMRKKMAGVYSEPAKGQEKEPGKQPKQTGSKGQEKEPNKTPEQGEGS